MSKVLILFLAIGTVLMGVPIMFATRKYGIRIWKGVVATVMLTVTGTVGTFLMFYVENGKFGGLSFYGAVFLVPIVFALISLLLRVPYRHIMDLCAIGECIMLALMKVHCIRGGCCIGRALFTTAAGEVVRFPSRIIELLTALVIFSILFYQVLKKKKRGEVYAWYLLIYGSTRFVLNIFREAWVTKETLLPFGNVWSLLAIAIGLIWLAVCRKLKQSDSVPE